MTETTLNKLSPQALSAATQLAALPVAKCGKN